MYVRKSKYGEFLGCSKFPRCKTTEPLDASKIKKEEKQ
jgi:ssDNA-binding Zn-finger/Zn-ribbon topoisomerase 1